ncbi:hypothetical protein RRG08_026748 [Elysia crispata]|uniref:Uncharacterized protein n=1 Tax=Elysia crispata TaxID=231223 RepID=A0AAE1AQI4_9GAST|nr:hypothetical protein RRG08_026748 [Elysia crispata]
MDRESNRMGNMDIFSTGMGRSLVSKQYLNSEGGIRGSDSKDFMTFLNIACMSFPNIGQTQGLVGWRAGGPSVRRRIRELATGDGESRRCEKVKGQNTERGDSKRPESRTKSRTYPPPTIYYFSDEKEIASCGVRHQPVMTVFDKAPGNERQQQVSKSHVVHSNSLATD